MVISKKKIPVFFVILSVLIVLSDQLLKQLILVKNPQWNFGFLTIHLVKNTGAGFGILQDHTLGLAFISLTVALVLLLEYRRIPQEFFPQVLTALFFGGVVGNLLDRFFRGYVIDFLDLGFWPAFNIADASISLAALGLIIYFWKK